MTRTASAEQKIVSADRKGEDLSNRVLLASIREGHGSFVLLICDSGETVVHSKPVDLRAGTSWPKSRCRRSGWNSLLIMIRGGVATTVTAAIASPGDPRPRSER